MRPEFTFIEDFNVKCLVSGPSGRLALSPSRPGRVSSLGELHDRLKTKVQQLRGDDH